MNGGEISLSYENIERIPAKTNRAYVLRGFRSSSSLHRPRRGRSVRVRKSTLLYILGLLDTRMPVRSSSSPRRFHTC